MLLCYPAPSGVPREPPPLHRPSVTLVCYHCRAHWTSPCDLIRGHVLSRTWQCCVARLTIASLLWFSKIAQQALCYLHVRLWDLLGWRTEINLFCSHHHPRPSNCVLCPVGLTSRHPVVGRLEKMFDFQPLLSSD